MTSRLILFLLHFAGNALLLWMGYAWLSMPESDSSHLVASAAVFLLIMAGVLWLQALAWSFFAGLSLSGGAWQVTRRLPLLLAWGVLAIAIYAALSWAMDFVGKPAFWIASFLTLHLRTPVSPVTVQKLFRLVVMALEWMIVPAALLPMAARTALSGWRGAGVKSPRKHRVWIYALEVVALLAAAFWIPFRLFFWIPDINSFNGQLLSFLLRISVGYLLAVVSLLVLSFFTAGGKPSLTHDSTVSLP